MLKIQTALMIRNMYAQIVPEYLSISQALADTQPASVGLSKHIYVVLANMALVVENSL